VCWLPPQVTTHAGWLSTNCKNQLDYYRSYLGQHNTPGSMSPSQRQQLAAATAGGSGSSSSGDGGGGASSGGPPQASSSEADAAASALAVAGAAGGRPLARVAEFSVEAARQLLEAEVKDTFLGTAGAAVGALRWHGRGGAWRVRARCGVCVAVPLPAS
jgi:hypothetical protein